MPPFIDFFLRLILGESNDGHRELLQTFSYSNPNDTYSASNYVNLAHQLTKKDVALNQSYLQSLLISPIVVFILGFLSISFFHIGMLCRCCVKSCKCLPRDNPQMGLDERKKDIRKQQLILLGFFYVFCLIVLIVDQLGYIGNESIKKGVQNIDDAVGSIKTIFTDLTTYGNSLVSDGTSLSDNYDSATSYCSYVTSSSISSDISTFTTSMKGFVSAVKPVTSKMTLVQNYIELYAVKYELIAFYVLWGLSIASVVLFVASQLLRSACGMKFAITFATFTYLIMIILGFLWMLISSALGDICMAPSYNVIENVPAGTLRNLTAFYSSCHGADTVGTYVRSAEAAIVSLNSTLSTTVATLSEAPYNSVQQCSDTVYIQAMQSDLTLIDDTFIEIASALSCSKIQALWFQVLNTGVCTNLFSGVFFLWFSQLVTSFFLFLVILLASISYQHFVYAPISPGSEKSAAGDVNNAAINELGYPVAGGADSASGEDHIAMMAVIDPGKSIDTGKGTTKGSRGAALKVDEFDDRGGDNHDSNEAAMRAENAAKAAFENNEGTLL